jgi:L-asparaginase II
MKMMQALPLVESGAADAAGLSEVRLALACASHQGAAIHTDMVTRMAVGTRALVNAICAAGRRCRRRGRGHAMIRAYRVPDQRHNNCSGKHTGF